MHRRFTAARLELGLVLLSLILWWIFPRFTWQPLLVCAAAAAIQLVRVQASGVAGAGRFHLAAGIWLATAAVGAWAAYDRQAGLRLFGLMAAGLLLFYALAALSSEELWQVVGIIGGFCSLLVVYFLLTNDWQWLPADVPAINRLGLAWMQIRPELSWQSVHPNMVAGVLASFFPVVLSRTMQYRRRIGSGRFITALVSLIVMGAGLLMTSSRAVWAILAAGLGLWWGLHTYSASILRRINPVLLATGLILLLLIAGTGVNSLTWLESTMVENTGSFGSRIELYRGSFQLARDIFLTGGGLGSFSGLYSGYILLSHVPIYFYSHNLYLDVLIEQGIFGLLAWLSILLGSIGMLLADWGQAKRENRPAHLLALPVLSGLMILAMHGLLDNPYYEPWSRPLIGVLPGISAALMVMLGGRVRVLFSRTQLLIFSSLLGLLLGASIIQTVRAEWLSNLAAIEMARVQLSGWPEKPPEPIDLDSDLKPVESRFQQVLSLAPNNISARYRLGLMAYQRQEFFESIVHLKIAESARPRHRGIRKVLGLALTWVGEGSQALERLAGIPEMPDEMDYYIWWWQQQNKTDLAQRAEAMAAELSGIIQP